MYVKVENNQAVKYPYTETDLRSDNPSVSFPKKIDAAMMSAYSAYPVTKVAAPSFDQNTHRLTKSVELVNGVWQQTWTKEQMPETEASVNQRNKRNKLLLETDVYGLSDRTMSSEMTTYRQALRDLPAHANWPFLNESDWPTKP